MSRSEAIDAHNDPQKFQSSVCEKSGFRHTRSTHIDDDAIGKGSMNLRFVLCSVFAKA